MNTLAKFHNNLPSSFLDFHQFVRKFPCFFRSFFHTFLQKMRVVANFVMSYIGNH